ncbi:MAG: DUF362 domain-containing protein [Bacteroidota bacterium]
MNRRAFFKSGLSASALTGSCLFFGKYHGALSAPAFLSESLPYDLVAVRGGEADLMFDRGIEALGGMKMFVRKGQTVAVKPNIGWDVTPERAGNTNPGLVQRIIEHCYDAGARQVYVFDHTCDNWQGCYSRSGIERAAKDAGAKVVPGDSESYYQSVSVPGGRSLSEAKEHEIILAADVFVNVPVLKSHSGTRLTIAMKNLMGVVWDRGFWHSNDLHQCIADFAAYRKPDLNIVDAFAVMKRNGPRGVSVKDVVTMKAQLISTDIVAVDTAATKLFGTEPEAVRYIHLAADRNVGRMDLENLKIKKIAV